jgi:hypothetical protein
MAGMMQMLDPFGFWKTSRDTTLEAWSKMMIDMVNSQEYARFTGTFLDQYLSMTQPIQDAVQRSMTMSLAYFNMPSREEVVSIADRLVHIETRLDDLDAETYDMHDDYPRRFQTVEHRIDKVEGRIATSEETVSKEIRGVDSSLENVLVTLVARLDKLEAAISQTRESVAKPEPRTAARAEPRVEVKADPKAEPKR